MKILGVILIIFGIIGLGASALMFGDIGIAAGIGAITAILTGIGFCKVSKKT